VIVPAPGTPAAQRADHLAVLRARDGSHSALTDDMYLVAFRAARRRPSGLAGAVLFLSPWSTRAG
jgi:hypothetical protein